MNGWIDGEGLGKMDGYGRIDKGKVEDDSHTCILYQNTNFLKYSI